MRAEEIYSLLEGNLGNAFEITMNDGTKSRVIVYGTKASDYGELYLTVSEQKGKMNIPFQEIKSISTL